MVNFAPVWWLVASGVSTTAVAGSHSSALGGRRGSFLSAHVEDLALAAEYHRQNLRVTQQHAGMGGRELPSVLQHHTAMLLTQFLLGEDDRHVRAFPAAPRQATLVECVRAELSQCVALAFSE